MQQDLSTARKVLWLGAHKTGTTFLQGMLDASEATLKDAGVCYQNLDEFRDKYTRPLLFKNFEESPAPASEFPIGRNKTILFDENIPALVQNAISTKGGLYPNTEKRVRKILTHLDYTPDYILFGIRSLDGFLPSLYCETLKSTKFRTFDEFMETVPNGMRWYDFLDRLAKLFPGVPLGVYTAEDMRGHEARFLSKITGVDEAKMQVRADQSRAGFSAEAVKRLNDISKIREVIRSDVSHMTRTYPKSKENPSFAPFGPDSKAKLKALYLKDREDVIADKRMTLLDFDNM